jgi:hypothetical protein
MLVYGVSTCLTCISSRDVTYVLLVVLALIARQVGTDLSSNTSAVANLDAGDLVANLDNLSDNLVSYAKRKRDLLSPSTGDGVDI